VVLSGISGQVVGVGGLICQNFGVPIRSTVASFFFILLVVSFSDKGTILGETLVAG
jgi:hypothetical protein